MNDVIATITLNLIFIITAAICLTLSMGGLAATGIICTALFLKGKR